MTREEVEQIWKTVKANQAKLRSCTGPHDFSEDITPNRPFGKRWRCTLCGGSIDTINRLWYLDGLEHGRKTKGGGT